MESQPGLFTLLVFRGITFNTQLLRDSQRRQLVFQSFQEWVQFRRNLQESGLGDNFICRKNAYGACISGRTPNIAEAYWNSSAGWSNWLQTHPSRSFKEVSDFIQDTFSQVRIS